MKSGFKIGGVMPRLNTKRTEIWGTGFIKTRKGFISRDLERVGRSDKWRKDRNKRKAARKSLTNHRELW